MNNVIKYDENKLTMSTLLLQLLALLLATGLLFSCGNNSNSLTPSPSPVAGDLVSWSKVGTTINTATLDALIASAGMIGFTAVSDVSCYKLTYKTPDASAALINASGLVCLPATRSGGNPVLSYQHRTIFQDSDAPSSFLTSAEGLAGAVFAAIGFIAVLPDYIGYGDSTALLHPYVHAATLASATVDMDRAARVFFKQPGINAATNGQLFLAGYSEGGYATLATQRLMEQSLSAEFPITASEPAQAPMTCRERPEPSWDLRLSRSLRLPDFFSRPTTPSTTSRASSHITFPPPTRLLWLPISEETSAEARSLPRSGSECRDERTVQPSFYYELPADGRSRRAQSAYC